MIVGRRLRFGLGAVLGLLLGIFLWLSHFSIWDFSAVEQISVILVVAFVCGIFLMNPGLVSGAVFGLVAGYSIAYRGACRFPCWDGNLSVEVFIMLLSVIVCGVFGVIWGTRARRISDTRA